jgi:hypothetical protein
MSVWSWYLQHTAGLAEVPIGAEGPYVRADFLAQVETQRELARIDAEKRRGTRLADDEALRRRSRVATAAARAREALPSVDRDRLGLRSPRKRKIGQTDEAAATAEPTVKLDTMAEPVETVGCPVDRTRREDVRRCDLAAWLALGQAGGGLVDGEWVDRTACFREVLLLCERPHRTQ